MKCWWFLSLVLHHRKEMMYLNASLLTFLALCLMYMRPSCLNALWNGGIFLPFIRWHQARSLVLCHSPNTLGHLHTAVVYGGIQTLHSLGLGNKGAERVIRKAEELRERRAERGWMYSEACECDTLCLPVVHRPWNRAEGDRPAQGRPADRGAVAGGGWGVQSTFFWQTMKLLCCPEGSMSAIHTFVPHHLFLTNYPFPSSPGSHSNNNNENLI